MEDGEINSVLEKAIAKLNTETEGNRQGKLEAYSEDQILHVRNLLIEIGTIRIGRRSKELVEMTIEESNDAEDALVDEEHYKIINAFNQKNIRTGELAPVPYSVKGYEILQLYITKLRAKLCKNTNVKTVCKKTKWFR